MWTPEDRAWVGDFGSGQALSDDQYRLIEPFIPLAKPGGRPRTTAMRRMLDGLFYVVRTGGQWRHGPPPPGPWAPRAPAPGIPAVADDRRLLPPVPDHRGLGNHPSLSGHDAARERRPGGQPDRCDHRHPQHQDHGKGGPRGYDAAKKVKGRKRHVAVDTLGLQLGVIVHAADIQSLSP